MKRLILIGLLTLSGCATDRSARMQTAIDHLIDAQIALSAAAPGIISTASVAAEGALLMSGNAELIPMARQAAALAQAVAATANAAQTSQ